MATADISGKKVAFLLTDGVEQIELTSPWQAVQDAGGQPVLVAPKPGQLQGFKGTDKADTFDVDVAVTEADPADYDALVLPGGVINADHLRAESAAVAFARAFFDAHKPVAAICHAPWLLIEAGTADGRRLTSYHTLATDLRNAGAHWVDREVVVDHGLVTSRSPKDLAAFNARMLEEIAEAAHAGQNA
ncbi:type 1 glutamine amidotransferase domain-containing protein [Arthrobacter mobilis]|uniref:Type 1 glutamine amidotransferase n=1 Tax=Arthrobacter mobilis TaxID=2724944 RepID=A0A7X6HCP4_9MICC|nr:type 1 glutamine amidotransferase domain-containing protein [Arthrobacter mobilis]NKX53511.1 type 1 glutamine amidotransferase [Arthrobacter mobilis]